MSSIYKKPTLTPRAQELQWKNIIWQTHEQICECNNPWLHLMILINKDSPARKPEPEIKNILCLLTGTDSTEEKTTAEENGGFDEGDLESLFKEDEQEEKDTEPTER